MCGIAGAVNCGDQEVVARLTEAQRSRGPDDGGTWEQSYADGTWIGLGNRRLAIQDLSPAGHMPMSSPDGAVWITFNGEIYNFRKLRKELEAEGEQFHSQGDTEVILHLYRRHGVDCLRHLEGMFAFAIWDAPRRRLFLARDPIGIKPLYYKRQGSGLLFASQAAALARHTGPLPRVNQLALLQYLASGSVGETETLFEGIEALPAAHYLVWENGAAQLFRYWNIDVPEQPRPLDNSVIHELRTRLSYAFRARLVSDVPVGIFLSGGIDSSAIVALLAAEGTPSLNTFSIVFREPTFNEARYSRAIARQCHTVHHELPLSQGDLLEAIPEAVRVMDQPTVDGINSYFISRETHRAGLKVALSGLGADEVFAGYATFKRVPLMETWSRPLRYCPRSMRLLLQDTFAGVARASDARRKLAMLLAADGAAQHPYFISRMLFVLSQQRQLLRADENLWAALESRAEAALQPTRAMDPVNRVSYLELRHYMLNTLLRDTDFMSMAHSLEVRVPFLDRRLVEFLFTLSGACKLDGYGPKHLLLRALQGLLPAEIVNRPKRGFTLPFAHWLREEMRHEVESVLLAQASCPVDEYLNRDAVRGVWEDFLAERTNWSRPWALYVLKKWGANHLV